MSEQYVTIERYDNAWHADLAQMRLEEAGIPVYMHNRNIVLFDAFLSNAVGSIKVQVPAEDADEAYKLIASIRDNIQHVTDQCKPMDEDMCLNCGKPMPEDIDTCTHCGWSYADQDPE